MTTKKGSHKQTLKKSSREDLSKEEEKGGCIHA